MREEFRRFFYIIDLDPTRNGHIKKDYCSEMDESDRKYRSLFQCFYWRFPGLMMKVGGEGHLSESSIKKRRLEGVLFLVIS